MKVYMMFSLRQVREMLKFVEEKSMREYGKLWEPETVTLSGELVEEPIYDGIDGEKQISLSTYKMN